MAAPRRASVWFPEQQQHPTKPESLGTQMLVGSLAGNLPSHKESMSHSCRTFFFVPLPAGFLFPPKKAPDAGFAGLRSGRREAFWADERTQKFIAFGGLASTALDMLGLLGGEAGMVGGGGEGGEGGDAGGGGWGVGCFGGGGRRCTRA